MSGRETVRPHDAGKERNDDGREMCEIDEEDEDTFGHKAAERTGKCEEDEAIAFDRMRPFSPDVEESEEGGVIAEDQEEAEEALCRK